MTLASLFSRSLRSDTGKQKMSPKVTFTYNSQKTERYKVDVISSVNTLYIHTQHIQSSVDIDSH